MTTTETTAPAGTPEKAPATTLEKAKDKAVQVLDSTRDSAKESARKTVDAIEANPLGVLVGGVALGVLVGALIPRTRSEAQLLAPVGKRLADTAKGAVLAAKDAGQAELDALGLNKNVARDTAGKLIDGVFKALNTAGSAAASAAKGAKKDA
ncbi:hypothetical protein [Sphingomonas immobilis]|uniref:DUF883 family protein n=1 Tax=Sphingomonas immobilis TaxID=3063997 RepID=A0ABT8ZUD9_9SPHN|nr:hypothetical protein [Sphingomonas sp. CA1-15]MDO7841186.1 hypothetical protein [Sphingomonas sp. CA1-15]